MGRRTSVHRLPVLCATFILACLLVGGPLAAAWPQDMPGPQSLDWIEPRSLNIFDIAGQVPDYVLTGHPVTYAGAGLSRYESGSRDGDTVTVTLKQYGMWYGSEGDRNTVVSMPSMSVNYDHMGNVAPACVARFYVNGQDVTDQVIYYAYWEPVMAQPEHGAGAWDRYPSSYRVVYGPTPGAEGLSIPSTLGGEIAIDGEYWEVVGVYTATVPNSPQVRLASTQHATFQTYIGGGGVGRFDDLLDQMQDRYGDRHARIMLDKPDDANYVLFNYPPMPFNCYGEDHNTHRPTAGTIRLAPDQAMLSADLVAGGAFPLNIAWQDADQSAGPMLSPLPPCDRLTPPEYVLPADIQWRDCYLDGDCSNSVLDEIYNSVMSLDIVYLEVHPSTSAVEAIHLDAADSDWDPSGMEAMSYAPPVLQPTPGPRSGVSALISEPSEVWVPFVRKDVAPVATQTPKPTPTLTPTPSLPDADRPYGYFVDGRMIGYAP